MEPNAPKLILVPTDFSTPSAQALRHGAALAERFSAHLLVIYADPFAPPVDLTISAAGAFGLPREEMIESAREQLQTFAEWHIPAAVPYEVRVLVSTPVDAIVAQASETGAGLIVMGTHGRTGLRRLLVGSVTEAVMRLARVPVIVVHEETPVALTRRVVSPPRSTDETAAAVAYAGFLAGGPAGEYHEISGGADLLEEAQARHADLIAVGIHGDRTLADTLRGTAIERVVRRSTCPVLTVNSYAARAIGREADVRAAAIA